MFVLCKVLKQHLDCFFFVVVCFLLFDKNKGSLLENYNVRLFTAMEHLKGFIVCNLGENQQQEFFMQTQDRATQGV